MSTLVKELPEPPLPTIEPAVGSLAEKIGKIGAKIPDAAWQRIPADAAASYRHYLYGSPKKSA